MRRKRHLLCAGDSGKEGAIGDSVSLLTLIVMRVGGESRRLTCHLGVEGNVFFTLGPRSPTVSTGNSSDDAIA